MDKIAPDSATVVYRMCLFWACVAGSWNITQICVPLIVRDIEPVNAPTWLGLMQSTNAVCGAVFCGLSGFYSDFLDRLTLMRPWALYFVICISAALVADVAGAGLYLLLVSRTAAIAIPTTLMLAYFSDFLEGAALLESYGYVSGTFGLSVFVSSLLCGVVNQLFSRVASLITSLLLAVASLVVIVRLREPSSVKALMADTAAVKAQKGKEEKASKEGFFRAMRIMRGDPYLCILCIACAIVRLSNMNDHLMLVYFISFRTKLGLSAISYVLSLMSLSTSFSQIVVLPFIARRHIVLPVLLAALVLMGCCLVVFGLAFTPVAFAVNGVVIGLPLFAASIFNARITSLSAPQGLSGVALGMVGTATNVTEVFAALAFGKILSWSTREFGPDSVYSGIPFFLNAMTVFFALGLVLVAEYWYGASQPPWTIEEKPRTTRNSAEEQESLRQAVVVEEA